MPDLLDAIALVYDDDAYREIARRPAAERVAGKANGLMGRQVAGKGFLDALLSHGRWSNLAAMVMSPQGAGSIEELWQGRPASKSQKRLRTVDWQKGWEAFLGNEPPARVLHFPGPPPAMFAWARSAGKDPSGFAITGVTHTICTADVMSDLNQLVTAPFEPFDAIICTSRAVVDAVRVVTGTYSDYLADRLGAPSTPALRPRVAMIPLGVDPALHRPPTPEERVARRKSLDVADDEVVFLFVGRLSFHAKAHPFPMYAGLSEAARRSGKKVRLVMCGWASDANVRTAFANGAAAFGPGVRTTFVDNLAPEARYAVWHVADVFTSLSDNVQETFGLSVIEAMSCGLPVVATDWNGYRDLVVDGETGILVPTAMVRDATADVTTKLLLGSIRYDDFLGQCSQATAVDVSAAAAAYERLIEDADLRRRMGAAGRARVKERFTWAGVVRAYEDLWAEQETERSKVAAASSTGQRRPTPACYPPIGHTFGGYPSESFDGPTPVIATEDLPPGRLDRLLKMALTGYLHPMRCDDPAIINRLWKEAVGGCTIAALDEALQASGFDTNRARATIAWMLKYDLLRVGE